MGRKKVIPEYEYKNLYKMRNDEGHSVAVIAKYYNTSAVTVHKILNKVKENPGFLEVNFDSSNTPKTPAHIVCEKSLENLVPFRPEGFKSKAVEKQEEFLKALHGFGFDAETIDVLLPPETALKPTEKRHFYKIVTLYLKDFENEELSSSDVDDVVGLAMSKILELRLLSTSKADDLDYTNVVNAVEKIHKRAEKLKESLSSRRSDRIDVRKKGNVSIVDLAAAFDEAEEARLVEKVRKLEERNQVAQEELQKYRNEDG